MAGVLRYTRVVRHPDTGTATALRKGEPVPAWASDLVHADDTEPERKPAPAKKAAPAKPDSK